MRKRDFSRERSWVTSLHFHRERRRNGRLYMRTIHHFIPSATRRAGEPEGESKGLPRRSAARWIGSTRHSQCQIGALGGVIQDTYGAPPRASSPPKRTQPDVGALHGAQSTLDSSDAGRWKRKSASRNKGGMHGRTRTVRTSAELAQEALESVLLEPLSSSSKPLSADGGRHASGRRSGAVAVEVLVHL